MLPRGVDRASAFLGLAILIGCSGSYNDTSSGSPSTGSLEPVYTIDDQQVRPGEGGAEDAVSVLASIDGDLNEDGRDDRAVILGLDNDSTGVFYHLNVFLGHGNGGWLFVGEEFLGDRIRFDFIDIYAEGSVSSITGVPIHAEDFGHVVVAFFARSDEQSFAEEPSLYLARHWKVEKGILVSIEDY